MSTQLFDNESRTPTGQNKCKFFTPLTAYQGLADGRKRGKYAHDRSAGRNGFASSGGQEKVDRIACTLLCDSNECSELDGFFRARESWDEGLEALEFGPEVLGPFGQSPREIGGFGSTSVLGVLCTSFLVNRTLLADALGVRQGMKLSFGARTNFLDERLLGDL